MALILLALLGATFGDTPEEIYGELKKAVVDSDWKGLYNTLAPSDRAMIVKEFGSVLKSPEGLARFAKMIGETEKAVAAMSAEAFTIRAFAKLSVLNKKKFEVDSCLSELLFPSLWRSIDRDQWEQLGRRVFLLHQLR